MPEFLKSGRGQEKVHALAAARGCRGEHGDITRISPFFMHAGRFPVIGRIIKWAGEICIHATEFWNTYLMVFHSLSNVCAFN